MKADQFENQAREGRELNVKGREGGTKRREGENDRAPLENFARLRDCSARHRILKNLFHSACHSPAATNPNKALLLCFLLSIYRRPLTCVETLTCFACCLGQHCSQVRSIQCSQEERMASFASEISIAATHGNDDNAYYYLQQRHYASTHQSRFFLSCIHIPS